MEHHEAMIKLQETANEIRLKVEMYLLALAFTITGLAIQSAKFSGDRWQLTLEISAWVLLIAAGIASVLRMQGVPDLFNLTAEEHRVESWLSQATLMVRTGITLPDGTTKSKDQINAEIAKRKSDVLRNKEKLNKMLGQLAMVRTPLLILGVVLLAVARAYAGLFVTCTQAVG